MMTALRDLLTGTLAEPLRGHLDDGPGWQVEAAGRPLAWESITDPHTAADRTTWAVQHASGLRAEVCWQRTAVSGAATLQVTLSNPTDTPSPALSALKLVRLRWLGVPRESIRLRTVSGAISHTYYPSDGFREKVVGLRPGAGDAFRIASAADPRTSDGDLPFLQMTVAPPIAAGLIIALEWSGPWYQQLRFEWSPRWFEPREPSMTLAEWDRPLLWEGGVPVNGLTLQPGETLPLPAVHFIAFAGDQDAGSNACRRYMYDEVAPDLDGQRPLPPLGYDHWMYVRMHFDEPFLRAQVDRVAELGLDYFILDAGWAAGASDDDYSRGDGNWEEVNANRFSNGLEPLAEYVHAKGLKFGLWFEPENAHRTSAWVRQHPDWFVDIGLGRLLLNLALHDAQDEVVRVISHWIHRLGLGWVRWDNQDPMPYWDKVDPTGKLSFSYLAGLYRIWDELRRRHPAVLFERCFAGRRPFDIGTLRRFHTLWLANQTDDALICRFMQSGANRFLTGHLLHSTIPVRKQAGDGLLSDLDVISRMCGALSCSGDVASWSPEWAGRVAHLLRIYREFRHLLVGDFYPLTPHPARPEEGEAVQFTSRDGREAVILGFRGIAPMDEMTVQPRALNADAWYEVWDPLEGSPTRQQGQVWLTEGLHLPLEGGAAIRRLRRVAEMGNG